MMEVLANRVRKNVAGGMLLLGAAQTENDRSDLFNAHPYRRIPLPQYYNQTREPAEVPAYLGASVVGNEFSANGQFGVRPAGFVRDQYRLDPADSSDVVANVRARFVSNVFSGNGVYGVAADAGQIATSNPKKHVVNIDLSFELTTLEGNGWATVDGRERAGGQAYFGFWRYASSVSAVAEGDLSFKFAHDSMIRVHGDITQLNYENRPIDPTDQTPTNNSLIVNDQVLTGFCVPLYGCHCELPSTSGTCE